MKNCDKSVCMLHSWLVVNSMREELLNFFSFSLSFLMLATIFSVAHTYGTVTIHLSFRLIKRKFLQQTADTFIMNYCQFFFKNKFYFWKLFFLWWGSDCTFSEMKHKTLSLLRMLFIVNSTLSLFRLATFGTKFLFCFWKFWNSILNSRVRKLGAWYLRNNKTKTQKEKQIIFSNFLIVLNSY